MRRRRAILLAVITCATLATGIGAQQAAVPRQAMRVRLVLTLRGHQRWISSVAFSPDGKRIASGGGDDTLKVWDARTGKEMMTLRLHGKGATALAFSPGSTRIVSGNWNGTLKVSDVRTGKALLSLRGHAENVTSVAFSPDGQRVVSGSGDDTLKVWDARTGKELLSLDHGNEYDINAVAFRGYPGS